MARTSRLLLAGEKQSIKSYSVGFCKQMNLYEKYDITTLSILITTFTIAFYNKLVASKLSRLS
jgi:hypothetical protein